MKRQFTIVGELTDLNTYIKSLNNSRWGGNDIKQSETYRVATEVRLARLEDVDQYPVKISIDWYSKDKRIDIDNVSFAKKFILDGMVEAGLIENDSRKYVVGIGREQFFIDKNRPRVEVTVESV